MISRTLANFDMPWLTCIGLLLFLSVFIGALLWVYRRGGNDFYENMQALPFDERT